MFDNKEYGQYECKHETIWVHMDSGYFILWQSIKGNLQIDKLHDSVQTLIFSKVLHIFNVNLIDKWINPEPTQGVPSKPTCKINECEYLLAFACLVNYSIESLWSVQVNAVLYHIFSGDVILYLWHDYRSTCSDHYLFEMLTICEQWW